MNANEIKTHLQGNRIALLIPTFNNAQFLSKLINEALDYCDCIIVVNDGSTDNTEDVLTSWKGKIHIVSYKQNKGKGYALRQGIMKAKQLQMSSVITLDSDGQHKLTDLPNFIEVHRKNPRATIIGSRAFDNPNMPNANTFANRFSNFWFTLQTAHKLPDTQTGYRLYPVKSTNYMQPICRRYEAEFELLVRTAWRLMPIECTPIHVYYPPQDERITHFRPFKDFARISLLNTLLCLLAIVYGYPSMAIRHIYRSIKNGNHD